LDLSKKIFDKKQREVISLSPSVKKIYNPSTYKGEAYIVEEKKRKELDR